MPDMDKTPLVLVHGAWHSGACWTPVVDRLKSKGVQVYAPDLPGHGNNALALNKVTLKAYVQCIVDLLTGIPVPVTLVGHSMAGIVISQVAAQAPQQVARLVYLSAYLPRHNESLFDLVGSNRGEEAPGAIELAMRISDDKRSCRIDDADITPLFHNRATAAEAHAAKNAFCDQATLPLAARVSLEHSGFDSVPRTYISCTADRVIPLHHQRRMLIRQPCHTLLQLDADHCPFLSCPAQIAGLLDACAAA